ncbi:MAG: tetratricopeptide repeat protein [Anaerolineae bacterium]|nr:tetratricopeptide repeat protein [Anaerolineae bacterium]
MLKRRGWLALLLMLALLTVFQPISAQENVTCDLDGEQAYLDRGESRWLDEDWAGVIADYGCALELNPSNTFALFRRGYAYQSLEDEASAEADYTAVLAILPDDSASLNNRGNIYFNRGDYDRAMADYDRAIEVPNEEKYIPYYNRGLLHTELGEFEAAIADLTEALELDPTYKSGYLSRAWVYQILENPAALTDIARWVDLTVSRTVDMQISDVQAGETLEMSEGTVFRVPFSAETGQIVRAAARAEAGSSVDPLLVILNADGAAVIFDDDSGVNLDAVVRYTIPEAGEYTLLVTHAGGGSVGTLALTVEITGEGQVESNDEAFDTFDLKVDTQAVVFTTEGDRLNLRSGPGLEFEILVKLERDTVVTLLEGPRKNDGYNWWRVQTVAGEIGWAVERVETEQTLQPALAAGQQAVVTTTEGDTLRAREGAGRSFSIVFELEPGTIVTLLEGPQIVDNLSWWKIRTPDGTEGWAVERVEDERTLTLQPTTELQ